MSMYFSKASRTNSRFCFTHPVGQQDEINSACDVAEAIDALNPSPEETRAAAAAAAKEVARAEALDGHLG